MKGTWRQVNEAVPEEKDLWYFMATLAQIHLYNGLNLFYNEFSAGQN